MGIEDFLEQDLQSSLTRGEVYQYSENKMPDNEIIIHRLRWSFGVLGMLGFVFNVFVIIRILYQGLRKVHLSKLYLFSLAVSDMLFGGTCFLYVVFAEGIIKVSNPRPLSIWFVVMGGLSFNSSLLLIILLTIDRFIAIRFPVLHKVKVTRKKVIVSVITVWLISIFITSTQYWVHKMVFDWVVLIAGITASFLLTITYIYIGRVTRSSNSNRVNNNRNANNNTNTTRSSAKSLSTTYLGFSITLTFIICNLPFSVATIIYLNDSWDAIVAHIIFILLSCNTVADPLIYTAVEAINKVLNKRRLAHMFRAAIVLRHVNPAFDGPQNVHL